MHNQEYGNRIRYIPITLYAIVMGLTGLAIVFGKFAQLQLLPGYLHLGMLYFVSVLFAVITVLYGIKAFRYFAEVKADFRHKIRINFFSAFSISFLLLSIGYHPVNHQLSEVLWWIGVIIHTYLMLYTISFWIQHNFEIQNFNPAWFIPVVGNIIIPVAGVEFMPIGFSVFYFSVGAFFWVILFTIFLNRVIFHDQMPQKFIPTLFILIAPPAVGFISYYKITGNWDLVSEFLVSITYLFVLLLIFLMKSFRGLKFFISWWAFTFPLDALTLASALAYQVSGKEFYLYAAWVSFALAIMFIGLVTYKTIHTIIAGRLCVAEE